jgi:predicted dehydrogenase
VLGAPHILADRAGPGKLRIACIGVGGQGRNDLSNFLEENIVALCDVDDKAMDDTRRLISQRAPGSNVGAIKTYSDYRMMFDQISKQLDAVLIATPDHQHAVPTLMAMVRGLHVYVEKPLAKTIEEARLLTEAAKKYKVITQMGNQGHSNEGLRVLCEYLWAGAIGNVRETYSWGPRGRGGVGGRPPALPVPPGLHWDEWIGPAPYRDYHEGLHPNYWRSWWEFGSGSVGDWGCHNLDGAYVALKLHEVQPTSVEAIMQVGGSQERYPVANAVCWTFPARVNMPPVKVHWYDGFKQLGPPPFEQNIPPIAVELAKKLGRLKTNTTPSRLAAFDDNGGTIYVGEKGVMFSEAYTRSCRILPEEAHQKFPRPARTLPRIKGTHHANFIQACKEGKPAVSDFCYAGPMTEFVFLALLAERAGLGQKVEWDSNTMQCTNIPALNALIRRPNRKGWEL